jgi:hypothetical protein
MAITLGSTDANLLDPTTWTAGTGGVGIFNANGSANEQNRYLGTDPWGNTSMVWQCTSTGGNDASGGWDTSQVSIDSTKLYRFSVWVKRTSSTSGGTFYFGLQTSTGAVTHLSSGAAEGNPYWQYVGTSGLTQDVWYLFVGHCYPVNHNGTIIHPNSGYYTRNGGKLGNNAGNIPNDCKWQSGTTTGSSRVYHYYCTDTTTRIEFYWPRIDLVNGAEPSIDHLLAVGGQAQGVTFSDSTKLAALPRNLGQLIKVDSFASSGTWYNTGASIVHAKVIGGGGGGAGYCESGGAGGFSEGFFSVTGVPSVTVTIGSAGTAVGYYAAAGGGGTSSFGSYCSATGGGGANTYSSHSGGHGGSGSGGQVNLQGGAGGGHVNSAGHWPGGRGGWGYFGGGAAHRRDHTNLTPGANTLPKKILVAGNGAPGSGGPGNQTDGGGYDNTGAPGESGLVIVYSYK